MNKKKFLAMCLLILMGAPLVYGAPPSKEKPAKTPGSNNKVKKIVTKKRYASKIPASAVKAVGAPKKSAKEGMNDSLQAWLKKMKRKVARSQAKHNQLVAVAAVRGSETPEVPSLYWKGKRSEASVGADEIKKFDEALEQALKGNREEAQQRLESFAQSHPDSSLKNDAMETIKRLASSDLNP